MSFVKRMNYFTNEMLNKEDFETEQLYHRDMRSKHNKTLHSSGIADGFELTSDGSTITIASGLAIDGQGREIYQPADEGDIIITSDIIEVYESITNDTDVHTPTVSGDVTVYLTLFLNEVDSDLQSEGVVNPTAKKIEEQAGIKFFKTEPANDETYLTIASMDLYFDTSTGWGNHTNFTDLSEPVTIAIDEYKSPVFIITDGSDINTFKLSVGTDPYGNEALVFHYLKGASTDPIFYINYTGYSNQYS